MIFIFIIVIFVIVVNIIVIITIIIMNNSFLSCSSSNSFVSYIFLCLVTHTFLLRCCVELSFSFNRQLFYFLVGCYSNLFFCNSRPLCLPREANLSSLVKNCFHFLNRITFQCSVQPLLMVL